MAIMAFSGDGQYFSYLYALEKYGQKKKFKVIVFKIDGNNVEEVFQQMKFNKFYCEFDSLSLEGN